MSDLPNPSQSKYTYLTSLSTDALKALLRADIEASTDDDYDTTYYILEILEQREKSCPTGCLSNVDHAWADFQKHYNTSEGDKLELYPSQNPLEEAQATTAPSVVPHRNARNITHTLRCLIAAATLLITCLIFAQASGSSLLDTLARWTSETFQFAIPGNSNEQTMPTSPSPANTLSDSYYDAIGTALDDLGITEKLAPSWYPVGFVAYDLTTYSNSHGDEIYGMFTNGADLYFDISISRYNSPSDMSGTIFHKDDGPVEEYTSNGRTFFIMSNIDSYTATWSDGQSLIVFISGNISKDEIIAIIDSIK